MNQYPRAFKNKYGKVTVYRTVASQYVSYRVLWRLGRKCFEERYAKEEKALARAEEILETLSSGQELLSRLDKEKMAYYITCEQMLEGKTTLMDLVRKFLQAEQKASVTASIDDCVEKYVEAMKKRGLSPTHIAPARSRLLRFAKDVGGDIGDVTVERASNYLNATDNLTTRFNERVVLKRFFTWCQGQGLLPEGEENNVFARTDVPKIKWEEPEIIPPEAMAKVMWVAKNSYPELVVPLALGAFAGLRRAEIAKLSAKDINMEEGLIIVSAEVTKTNQRRVIVMNGTLRAWLEDYLKPGQNFNEPSYKYKVKRCVDYAKAPWPTNGLRHSYVSYRLQNDKDIGAVAHECGHSPQILMRHYKCLCTPADAVKWFDILPETTNFGMESSGVERITVDS